MRTNLDNYMLLHYGRVYGTGIEHARSLDNNGNPKEGNNGDRSNNKNN